jgi:hypothetical protein
VLCLALAAAMPLRNWWHGDAYLGNVSPNVWHNPTGVFAITFAVGLFIAATRLMNRVSVRAAAWTGLAMCLSLLAKPNYVMAFAPCYAPFLLAALRRAVREEGLRPRAAAGILFIVFGPGAVILAAQYVWLTRDARIIFDPFSLWRNFNREHITAGILIGIAFPLAVFVCYPRRVNASQPLVLAWYTLAVGIGTNVCFRESGARLVDGNFFWGMNFADHVLFVASTAFLVGQRNDLRRVFCFAVLGLHALSGVTWLASYVATPLQLIHPVP